MARSVGRCLIAAGLVLFFFFLLRVVCYSLFVVMDFFLVCAEVASLMALFTYSVMVNVRLGDVGC